MQTSKAVRRWWRYMVAFSPLLLIAACDDWTSAAFAPVATTWVYEMSIGEIDDTPEPGDLECRITDAMLTLSGSRTFSGEIDGELTCALIGEEQFDIVFSDRVANGFVQEDSVQFRIGTWQHVGTLSDSSMTGSVEVVVGYAGTLRTVTGAWMATRQ